MRKAIMIMSVLAAINVSAHSLAGTRATHAPALVEQNTKHFDYIGVVPSKVLGQYTSIYIDDVTFTFDKRWLRVNRHDVNQRYRDRLAKEYSQALKDALAKAITKNKKVTLADTLKADTLILRPHLEDVRVNGPDNDALVDHLVHYAGDAKLNVFFYEGDDLVAQLTDYSQTRDRGIIGPEPTNRARNYRDFSMLMARWSKQLMKTFW